MSNEYRQMPQDSQEKQAPINEKNIPVAGILIFKMLSAIKHGSLLIKIPDGSTHRIGDSSYPIFLELFNWNMCKAALRSGDIGFAETFIDGDWKTTDLAGLIELLARNREHMEALVYGKWWGRIIYRLKHILNRNSRVGSKRNIHDHYDIGNPFYRLWLDPSMTYSSAIFDSENKECGLEKGQQQKYHRVLKQIQLPSNANVLEIGCGWGGFAEVAAIEAGAHVTGLTLSVEQLNYANNRMANAGLTDFAQFQLCDYRDAHGQYDAIASIEMFEAVGEQYWPDFFDCIVRNLKHGGYACIQTITIADSLFERYRKGTDFIQQYIFPGGMLPSPSEFRRQAENHGLRVTDEFHFGLDYAKTLNQWRINFEQQKTLIQRQGFDQNFMLTWEFYLAYCEGAFRAGSTDVVQFTLLKD